MGKADESPVVDFDADAALAAVQAEGEGVVHLCVAYTSEEFHTLYADEATMALFDDRDQMTAHFEEVHSYVHADFTERDLFGTLFPGAGEVRSFVTYMDHVALVRVLVGQQGLFLSVDADADVARLVSAVETELG